MPIQTEYTQAELAAIGVRYLLDKPKLFSFDLQKIELLKFWKKTTGRKGFMPKAEKLQLLREMAEIVIPYKKQQTLTERREKYNEVKDERFRKTRIGSSCWVCRGKPQVRHHIIQLQNGGINSRKNIVPLCHGCHAEIHPWLKKREPMNRAPGFYDGRDSKC